MTVRTSWEAIRSAFHAVGPGELDDMVSDRTIEVVIPGEAAAADTADYVLFEAQDHAIELHSASITCAAIVGIDAVNIATLTLSSEDGAAGGLVALDAMSNAVAGFAARVPQDFTVVPATDTLALGEILVLAVTKAAAGTQLPDMLFRATYRITD